EEPSQPDERADRNLTARRILEADAVDAHFERAVAEYEGRGAHVDPEREPVSELGIVANVVAVGIGIGMVRVPDEWGDRHRVAGRDAKGALDGQVSRGHRARRVRGGGRVVERRQRAKTVAPDVE